MRHVLVTSGHRKGQRAEPMYSLAAVDDETELLELYIKMVEDWAQAHGVSLVTSVFSSAEEFLFSEKSFDILFLDIGMGGKNGMELAHLIRQRDENVIIVFITGDAGYASEGYEVSAFHYLIKPVSGEKISEVLTRATKKLDAGARTIIIPQNGGKTKIAVDDVLYAEVFSHRILLYLKSHTEEFAMSISAMEKYLGDGFFRCHRSYIASLKHTRRITRTAVILANGIELPLARGLYDSANQAFIHYN